MLPDEADVTALPPGLHEDIKPVWGKMPVHRRFVIWNEIVDYLNDIRQQRKKVTQEARTTARSSEPIPEPPDAGGPPVARVQLHPHR